ncbi:CBS domain-containing protein [Actinopolymorpha singaporensis]
MSEAASRMTSQHVGALAVVVDGNSLVGILSERDVVRAVAEGVDLPRAGAGSHATLTPRRRGRRAWRSGPRMCGGACPSPNVATARASGCYRRRRPPPTRRAGPRQARRGHHRQSNSGQMRRMPPRLVAGTFAGTGGGPCQSVPSRQPAGS